MSFILQAKIYTGLKLYLRKPTFFNLSSSRFFSSTDNSAPEDNTKLKWDLNNVIMVWNTPWTAHESDILKAFTKCGTPKLAKNWPPTKGITLIQFQNESEVNKALNMQDKDYMGRRLMIRKIVANTDECKTILASNIPPELEFNKQKLKDFVDPIGKLEYIHLNRDHNLKFVGSAFLKFVTTEDALNAFKLHNKKFLGKNIQLAIANDRAQNSY